MSLFNPSSFNLTSNEVYVIIEVNSTVAFSENTFRVVGVCYSLESTKIYAGPNRIIKGPVPIFDRLSAQPKTFEPVYNPFKPDEIFPPKPFMFNSQEPARPKFDFGMNTPQQPNPFNSFYPQFNNLMDIDKKN